MDNAKAEECLRKVFDEVQAKHLAGNPLTASAAVQADCSEVFGSSTQAYREALLGCVLGRCVDPDVDVHLPYKGAGPGAFSGRTLDEKVVNGFLHDRSIPCSQGPYLSVFRRSVAFNHETRKGLKDKTGYDALLRLLDFVEGEPDVLPFLRYLLFRFILLREAADVPLTRLRRMSLEQCGQLVRGLLGLPSGGRFPVLFVVAAFRALIGSFKLPWQLNFQGINVSDKASGAGGDITICAGDHVVLAAEVTERVIDRSRIVATFNTKISPARIADYLFFTGAADPSEDALAQVRQYFSQGHDINFVQIESWIRSLLATLGAAGRERFAGELADLVGKHLSATLKMAWNEQIAALTRSGGSE